MLTKNIVFESKRYLTPLGVAAPPTGLPDVSRYKNHGTFGAGAAAPRWTQITNTPAPGLWSLRFDGGDYIDTTICLNDLSRSTKGTLAGWFRLSDAIPAVTNRLITFGDTTTQESIRFAIVPSGVLSASCIIGAIDQWVLSTNAIASSDNVYAHLAVTQNGVAPVLYVNGFAVPQSFSVSTDKTKWLSACTGIDNGRIGCVNKNSAGNTEFLDGYGDMIKILNIDLTPGQISKLFESERRYFGV